MSSTPAPTVPDDWARVKAVFEAVVDLPPAERAAALAAAALTPAVRAELDSLLAHHDVATVGTVFLVGNAAQALAEVPAPAVRPGQRLGAWEIVRALGSGGMGEVFEARRADGRYEGRAAVKLLKRGMDSAAVLQRFAQERQALARLSHPHIARLLDAGASDEGLPYFVLEFVDGRPVDEAARALPLEARLHLFLQLADAVAHAHRNLLVHRDLKPGNVLVDGDGQVKLLDFGIAKALDPLEGHDGAATVGGVRPYTPHYASPEQLRGEPVSTATDIYSLGVLLYEMLTGTRPTGRRATTPTEAVRSALEDAPTRPSRLAPDEVADPHWLQTRRRLEGDLDNILLKALEKDIGRRYASVDALAADVQACLAGRPVSARAASPAYVMGRFVKRHAVAVLAGGLGAVGLVFGLATSIAQGRLLGVLGAVGAIAAALGLALAMVQARRAALARQAAVGHVLALRQLGREVVLGYGDLVTFLPGGMERKAALLATTAHYFERLLEQAPDDGALQAELGVVCARLAHLRSEGEFAARAAAPEVLRHGQRALALFAAAERVGKAGAEAAQWWALVLGDLARVAQEQGELAQAGQRLDEADAVLARALQREPRHEPLLRTVPAIGVLRAQLLYGWDRPTLQQPEAALEVLARVRMQYLQARERAQARGEPPAAYDVFQLGTVDSARALILARQRRHAQAAAEARSAVAWREQALALEPHNRVMAGGLAADRNLLAGLCLDLDDAAAALAVSGPGWAALQTLVAEDRSNETWPAQRRWLAFHHGRALLGCGRPAEALPVLQVSEDWLAPQAALPACPPRLRARWARTRCAMARARQALGLAVGPLVEEAADALEARLRVEPGDDEARQALAECRALPA